MARVLVTTAVVLSWLVTPWAMATAAEPEMPINLQIAAVPDKDEKGRLTIHHDKHFNVHLTNRSGKPVHLWHDFCEPGHATMTFRITEKNGTSWTMRKTDLAGYWEDVPLKTIVIAPGATYVWRVVPTQIQREWTWTGLLEPNGGEEITIVPIFEIKPDAQAKAHGVWTGRIEGPPVKVYVLNSNLTTPHQYLWNQCPRQALRLMQADRKWINKQEPEYQCTPLHHASRFRFVEVVEWLLANGADVDARAYNDFSPLYFADDPKVARAILRHKPKDSQRAVEFFRSPLENAASEVAQGGSAARKWREIVQLMLDAGAPYSLRVAGYLNDVARIRAILKEQPRQANADDNSRQSPLRVAARLGRIEICKILLQNNADPNDWEGGGGFPILVPAIEHPEVVKLLLDAGADVKTRISWGGSRTGIWTIDDEATALHFAAQHGALESAKLLVQANIDIHAKDTTGQTALDIAARCRQGEVAYFLAGRMGSAEARDKGLRALLHQLVFLERFDRLKTLLKQKSVADVFAQEGPRLMQAAAFEFRVPDTSRHQRENDRCLAIIETLHAHGIPIDIYSAVTSDNTARVKELLKADPGLASMKIEGKRPVLHWAVELDRGLIAVLLMDAGANPNDPDQYGSTALHAAAFWRRPEIAKLLIKKRADVKARAKNGATPLHEAARMRTMAVAKLLVEAGADVNAMDNEGRTPLTQTDDFEDGAEVMKLLIQHGGRK